MIVDFAIADDPECLTVVTHGLLPGGAAVDDCQTPVPKTGHSKYFCAVVIRSAVSQYPGHSVQQVGGNPLSIMLDDSAETTHFYWL
jgi:hypothetical protein